MVNNSPKNKEIVVGISGGIDSSVALILLRQQGWKPRGVFLELPVWKDRKDSRNCHPYQKQSQDLAHKVCRQLNIPYFPFPVKNDFKKTVVKYFISEIKAERTPNPCIICNRYFKIKKLFEFAKKHHIYYVATGHYARLRKGSRNQEYQLLRARDKDKDQTYYLSLLPQKWLKHLIFPLGNYTKEEIYKIAKRNNLDFLLKRKESQDFCFLRNYSLKYFLEKAMGEHPGLIKDINGHILGKHRGLYFYTIGQRKNIGLSNGPYFVLKKDSKNNILFVTKNEEDLEKKEATIKNIHWISSSPQKGEKLKVKIRYKSSLASIIVSKITSRSVSITFKRPQRALTPGQFCVFYKGIVCLGGGEIE